VDASYAFWVLKQVQEIAEVTLLAVFYGLDQLWKDCVDIADDSEVGVRKD